MWGVALIFIAVASCNAELYEVKTAGLPTKGVKRIIGGSSTTIDKYPFVVQVRSKNWFICGGSLVSRLHVLSAAHCFVDREGNHERAKDVTIREGTTFLNKGGSVHLVKEIIVHKLYNYTHAQNDVAMVVMATPVDFRISAARPTNIARQDAVLPDKSFVTAVGWGLTKEDVPLPSEVLNEITVRKIKLDTCRDHYKKSKRLLSMLTNSTICAGILGEKKGVCSGDSGGPLIYEGILVGITSWNIGCAHPKYPAVYARVAQFSNWIIDTVKNSQQQNDTDLDTCSLGSKVGAITLLTPVLFLIPIV